jgi:hypothetical protein
MKKSYEKPTLARVELVAQQSVLAACMQVSQSGWTVGAWNCGGSDPNMCGPAS